MIDYCVQAIGAGALVYYGGLNGMMIYLLIIIAFNTRPKRDH